MATFSKGDDGVWTVTLDETDSKERNPIFDEAVPRYLTAFDPAFAKASEEDEAEYIKALLRAWPMQDAGWDAYGTTLRAIPAMMKLHAVIPAGDEWYETSRHLALWTWGHVVEASEPYAIVADMLHIANGGFYMPYRFPQAPPPRHDEKMAELDRLADAAGMPDVLKPMKEVWDRELRNAVFHADYTVHGGETRIPGLSRSYSHEEVQTLVNRGLAYHEALTVLRRACRAEYAEPRTVTIKASSEEEQDELGVVMVRDGVGAIGLKHPHTTEAIAAGAIPWHMALLYPDEAEALRADPTLAQFPAQPSGGD